MADTELEIGSGGGGGRGVGMVLIFLPCWPFSVQSFLPFMPKIRGGHAASLGPSPRSATGHLH